MKQKQNKNHIIFISVMALAICILTVNQGIPAMAKSVTSFKKLSVSRSSMKMNPGTQKKLTIKNAHKKVKWSSSNRKIAVITSKTGKYKNKAVIQAKKTGTCTITVKSGSLKRKCKIRVLEDSNTRNSDTKPNSNINPNTDTGSTTVGVQFESVSATESSIAVTLKIYNNTKQQINYGLACMIEKQIDGKWTVLETTEPQAVPCIACIVEANSSHSHTFRVTKLKDPVTKGNYRITLLNMPESDPSLPLTVVNSATFQITEPPIADKTPSSSKPSPTLSPTTHKPSPTLSPAPELSPEKASVKMTLSDINYSDNRLSVKMTVQNNSTAEASLSRIYGFEKWEDGAWQPVLPKEPLCFTCDMILLPGYGHYEETCSLEPKEPLTAGTYRLVRPGIFCEDPDAVIEKTAEFVIQ